MIIVGISGLAGSGKSTVAEHLIAAHGFARVKFASGLKLMLYSLLAYRGLDNDTIDRMIEGDLKELPTPYLNGRTPRHAMITLGTEWGRDYIDVDLWARAAVDHIREHFGPDDRVLLDDVRFPNEDAAIRELGGHRLHIDRPGLIQGSHASEQLRPAPADFIMPNDSTKAMLLVRVDRFFEGLFA